MTQNKDDLVKLVNTSDKPAVFNYDGAVYSIKKNAILKRHVAEHGLKKTYSIADAAAGKPGAVLKIEELPEGQRSPEEYPAVSAELATLKEENQKLKDEIAKLKYKK